MKPPFVVRVGTPGGEYDLCTEQDAARALRTADLVRAGMPGRRVVDVICTDVVDPPETGTVVWCENCGLMPVLFSQHTCSFDCTITVKPDRITDYAAMERITAYLNQPGQWNGADVCDYVAGIIQATGRKLLDNGDE